MTTERGIRRREWNGETPEKKEVGNRHVPRMSEEISTKRSTKRAQRTSTGGRMRRVEQMQVQYEEIIEKADVNSREWAKMAEDEVRWRHVIVKTEKTS